LLCSACIEGKQREQDGGGTQDLVSKSDKTGPSTDGNKADSLAGDAGVPIPGTWKYIKPKPFFMGAAYQEACADFLTQRRHQVTLTHAFEIMTTEVTQAQYMSLMTTNPSYFKSSGDSCPVDNASWYNAVAYCNALSQKRGLTQCYSCTKVGTSSATCTYNYSYKDIYACPGYRLPTEAEWEYAYRADTTTAYYNGDNDTAKCKNCTSMEANANKLGWYCYNSQKETHPVGKLQPNAYGLLDMGGNVQEWTADGYKGDLGTQAVTDPWNDTDTARMVVRGGYWEMGPERMRAAWRDDIGIKYGTMTVGFRCARTR